MPLNWSGASIGGSDLTKDEQAKVRTILDALGDAVAALLTARALNRFDSPLFRQFALLVILLPDK